MQNYKEINGNDYVKDSRTTINETMRSIQSMNSGTVFPTTNLFEGMKCYRTDLKKTYTLTDVENNTWVEDAHAELADEATHAASATRLQTPSALNLSGAVTADAANFDGTADATINVKTLDASKLKGTTSVSTTGNAATATKLAAARTIALSGNASGSTTFDGSGNATINATVNESAHAATATKVVTNAASGASANIAEATMGGSDFARIRVSGASDVNELALETADNGDEAIVARQYTGDFKDVARTASILDANGNTSFPGTVVAPKFTGALNGNAATASKLLTPRTISLTGKAAGSASFDGSSNASINVTSVNADTASKLSTARKINITGNATGAASFDGSGDVNISVTVNESKHAAAATTLKSSSATETSTVARPIWLSWEGDNTKQTVSPNLTYTCSTKTLTAANFAGHLAGNASTASRLATPRTISLSGNARGSANFDGSGDVEIKTTNNYAAASGVLSSPYTANNRTDSANKIYGDGGLHYFLATSKMTEGKPPEDAAILHLAWDSTYGWEKQFAVGVAAAYWRSQNSGKWGAWKTFLDSTNYNNYAPTKTGTGASGTWGINISGNAANATKATTAAACTGNSATASRLATARSIALTGNATGSATFDGSGNISISTNVNTASNADKLDNYHASDILNRISAANTGGIVAASLTANGYAKFANGLILQWGFVSNTRSATHYDITFPITFASKCYGVHSTFFKPTGGTQASGGDLYDTVALITTKGCELGADNQSIFWTAIGV